MAEAAARMSLLAIGVSRYDNSARDRPAVADATCELADLLAKGVANLVERPREIGTVTREQAQKALESWGEQSGDGVPGPGGDGFLVWSGHCELRGLGRNVKAQLLTSDDKEATYIADLVAKAEFDRWVIVIDSCYAAEIAEAIAHKLERVVNLSSVYRKGSIKPVKPGYVVIASTSAEEEAGSGVVPRALTEVLKTGPDEGWWGRGDELLTGDQVFEALGKWLEQNQVVVDPRRSAGGADPRVFPNPMYVATAVATTLEIDKAHFLPRAAGIEAGETGWYFTGREEVLRQLVAWLDTDQWGMHVVTGSAGSGKSAVLGRLVTLSVARYRGIAEQAGILINVPYDTLPRLGTIQVALHVHEKTISGCLAFIGEALGLGGVRDPGELLDQVRKRSDPLTIVADALDEAGSDHARRIFDELLVPLARIKGVKVLVGTRPGVISDWTVAEGLTVTNLDDDPDTSRDVETYAFRRLTGLSGSPYRGKDELCTQVATAITKRATSDGSSPAGAFLIAHVTTRTLCNQPDPVDPNVEGWEQQLPDDVGQAFDVNLDSYKILHGDETARILRDLLTGLAWEEGNGLPRELIRLFARAITGGYYTDDDVSTLFRLAGGHVIEVTDSSRAVYRLYHELFREHLRRETLAAGFGANQVHKQIVEVVTAVGRNRRWADIDPYSRRSLIRHATLSRTEGLLYGDDDYLVAADPEPLAASAPWLRHDSAGEAARRFLYVAHGLNGIDPVGRRFALSLADAITGRPQTANAIGVTWRRGRWGACSRVLTGHDGEVHAVATMEIDGDPVVVSGGKDGTVRLWDARSGRPRGEPLTGHLGEIHTVATMEVNGAPVVVSGGEDGKVRLWDARSGKPGGELIYGKRTIGGLATRAVGGVATILIDSEPVVVCSGSRGFVRMWNASNALLRARFGTPVRGVSSFLSGFVPYGPVAVTTVDGEPLVIIGVLGDEPRVQVWNARSGKLQEEFTVHEDVEVLTIVAMEIDGEPVIVSGCSDGTVWLFEPRSHRMRGEPFTCHRGPVDAVTTVQIDGDPVVVSGGEDGTVRLWDARSGRPRSEPLIGHDGKIHTVAAMDVDGDPVIVSGGADGTVRLWDARGGQTTDESWTSDRSVDAVATTIVNTNPVIVTSHLDRVQIWDARNGQPRGDLFVGNEESVHNDHLPPYQVRKLAALAIDGDLVVATLGNGDVRLIDARGGQRRCELLSRRRDTSVVDIAGTTIEGEPVLIGIGSGNSVYFWNARTGQLRGAWRTPSRFRLRRIDLAVRTVINSIGIGETSIASAVVDGNPVIVMGGSPFGLMLFDPRAGESRSFRGINIWRVDTTVVDGNPVIISGEWNGIVRVWDARTLKPRGDPLTRHSGPVVALATGIVNKRVIVLSASADGNIHVCDVRTGELLSVLPLLTRPVALSVEEDSGIFVGSSMIIGFTIGSLMSRFTG
jgi:WD40 repeat protein